MSKIGKQELVIPTGVTVTVNVDTLTIKGKGGELVKKFDTRLVEIKIADGKATVSKKGSDKKATQLWGTMAAHIKNMIKGVETPYTKKLLVEGVGFKWELKGDIVNLSLGFSHPITMKVPAGLTVKTDKGVMDITGIDKELVGLFAKNIRQLKTPEPYKGKGIRYSDEVIRRKQGKRSA